MKIYNALGMTKEAYQELRMKIKPTLRRMEHFKRLIIQPNLKDESFQFTGKTYITIGNIYGDEPTTEVQYCCDIKYAYGYTDGKCVYHVEVARHFNGGCEIKEAYISFLFQEFAYDYRNL